MDTEQTGDPVTHPFLPTVDDTRYRVIEIAGFEKAGLVGIQPLVGTVWRE